MNRDNLEYRATDHMILKDIKMIRTIERSIFNGDMC